jgi:hypothetical protein
MGMRAGRGRGSLVTAALGLAWAAAAFVPGTEPSALAQATDVAPNRAVVEQKLKLLENLLNSPRSAQLAAGKDAEAASLMAQARRGVEEARTALAAGDVAAAGALLDQALKASSTASARATRGGAADAAQRNRNRELLEELNSYRVSLNEAVKEKGSVVGAATVQRIDQLTAQAAEMTAAHRHAAAGKLLAEAYGMAVATLSELRAGQTVTMALKFDTPADEYAYEQKRHRSNEMLIEMLITEGKVDASRRQILDRYLEESFRLRSQAEQAARADDYPAAIKIMEKANDQLMNALRASGLANF